MKDCLILVILAYAACPHVAQAQRVEVEAGGGYVFAGGAENPGPSLATVDVGVVVWPWTKWGVAVRLVEGPGEDLHEPVISADRTFLGQADLHYWTVTVRRRIALTNARGVELGFGQLFGGRFSTVQQFHDPPRRVTGPHTFFPLGSALEAFITQAAGRHFAVKGGLTFDFNVETTNLQPVVLAVIRF
jgi:hypothetical protein